MDNKKQVLIIPDIHLKWEMANRIIDHVGADEIIFLGDYFDDFNDTPEMVNEMVDWLEHSVRQPNRIHIVGNHDMHYAFPEPKFICSGFKQWKMFIIRDRLSQKFWENLKFYHILDGTWFCSHAGLHDLHVPHRIKDLRADRPVFLTALSEYLDKEIIKGFRGKSWIFRAGRARGGIQRVGGITWCDYTREFKPVVGLNQLLGHTPIDASLGNKWINSAYAPKPPDYTDTNHSYNLDIDTWGGMRWAVWDGSTLEIGNYSDM
jgi:hypothetical protein